MLSATPCVQTRAQQRCEDDGLYCTMLPHRPSCTYNILYPEAHSQKDDRRPNTVVICQWSHPSQANLTNVAVASPPTHRVLIAAAVGLPSPAPFSSSPLAASRCCTADNIDANAAVLRVVRPRASSRSRLQHPPRTQDLLISALPEPDIAPLGSYMSHRV